MKKGIAILRKTNEILSLSVTLLLCTLSILAAANPPPLTVQLDRFQVDGRNIIVASIYGQGLIEQGVSGLSADKLGRTLLERADNFIYGQYRARYPDIPPTFFEEMKSKNPVGAPGTVMLLAFSEDQPNETLATLKLSFRVKANPQLPLERLLDVAVSSETRPMKDSEWPLLWKHHPSPLLTLWQGGAVELGNFVKDPNSERYLIPLLWHVAEHHQLTTMVLPMNGGRMMGLYVFPATYYLVCDERMVSYYEKLGFQKIMDPISGNYVMSAERYTFYTTAAEKLWNVEGAEKLRSAHVEWGGGWDRFRSALELGKLEALDPASSFTGNCGSLLSKLTGAGS